MIAKETIAYCIALLIVAVVIICAAAIFPPRSSNTSPSSFVEASIVRVVDGDTIMATVADDTRSIRLCGVDAPESKHPDESRNVPEGDEACAFLETIVKPGQKVFLQRDVSDADKYGRLVRYVWLSLPDDQNDPNEVGAKMANAIMLREGYAKPLRCEPDTRYAPLFDSLAAEASEMSRGVSRSWANDALPGAAAG